MASVGVLPLADYPAQTRNFGPVAIGDTVTSVDFSVARCTTATPTIWPSPSVTLTIALEISINNGPFTSMGGFTAPGGIGLDKFGNEATVSRGGGGLPAGINRRIQGTIIIAGGTLRSSATVEVN